MPEPFSALQLPMLGNERRWTSVQRLPRSNTMNPLQLFNAGLNPIRLDSADGNLAKKMSDAAGLNCTLRLKEKVENGQSVLYLRARTFPELMRETLDRIFRKGTVATQAKERAWAAVHKVMKERLANIYSKASTNLETPGAQSPKEQDDLPHKRGQIYEAAKTAKDAEQEAAQAVYACIMGVAPNEGAVAIISDRVSIRYRSPAKKASDQQDKDFAEAFSERLSDSGDDVTSCIKSIYLKRIEEAKAAATTGIPRLIECRFSANGAQWLDSEVDAWQSNNVTAMQQAIEDGLKSLAANQSIEVSVDNEAAFELLRDKLRRAEQDKLFQLWVKQAH
jgi:hypothetical protein